MKNKQFLNLDVNSTKQFQGPLSRLMDTSVHKDKSKLTCVGIDFGASYLCRKIIRSLALSYR